jgi:hypothetical protein
VKPIAPAVEAGAQNHHLPETRFKCLGEQSVQMIGPRKPWPRSLTKR